MSVINRMLQDLDRRQAGLEAEGGAPAEVRAVRAQRSDREWFWRIVAVLLLAAVCWVAWVAYQMQPISVVTPLALKSPPPRAVAVTPPSAPNAPAPAATPAPAAASTPAPEKPAAPPAQPPETLKLAGAIERPIPEAPAVTKASGAAPKPASLAAPAAPATPPTAAPSPAPTPQPQAQTARQPATSLDLGIPPARVLPSPASAKVEKRDPVRSPQQRAEADFRRAVGLLNNGRASEAEEALLAAVAHDHAFHPARQALVALLLDAGRLEEARRHLQEGLAVDPRHTRFATVLARLLAERKDYGAALEVLERAKAEPASNAEFSALQGTVLQRLGRHREAADAYGAAVRLDQGNGGAWIGLALSLEATQRPADAAAAYRRASALPNLSEEVRTFAAQRARQLQ